MCLSQRSKSNQRPNQRSKINDIQIFVAVLFSIFRGWELPLYTLIFKFLYAALREPFWRYFTIQCQPKSHNERLMDSQNIRR